MKLIMENWRRFLLLEDAQDEINNFLKELNALNTPAEKLEYTEAKLGYLGEGSSRLAYVLEDRVLKIAMNRAGIAQNKVEANVRTQEMLKPWAAKVYDRDPDFQWILQEKVDAGERKTINAWIDVLGGEPEDIDIALRHFEKVLHRKYNFEWAWAEAKTFGRGPFGAGLKPIARDLVMKLHRLGMHDLSLDNSGVTHDGRPVILDAGFDESVAKIYGADMALNMIRGEDMFLDFQRQRPK